MTIIFLFRKKVDDNRLVRDGLRSVYGFGNFKVNYLYSLLGIKKMKKLKALNNRKLNKLNQIGSQFIYENRLKKIEDNGLLKAFPGGSHKELRLQERLPVNGQRTRSNSRTSKMNHNKLYARLVNLKNF